MVEAKLTVRQVKACAVLAPLKQPIRAAVGTIPSAPLVLIDVTTEKLLSTSFRIVAANAEFVTFRVTKIRPVIIGMIVRSQAGRAFASSAGGDRFGIATINRVSIWREQGHHLPVPRRGVLPIVGLTDEKEWSFSARLHPASPGLFWLYEFQCEAELIHDAPVERKRAFEVVNSDMDMR